METSNPVETLARPLPVPDLAGDYDFEQIELRGVSLAVDAVARERIAAAHAVTSNAAHSTAAIPYLTLMLGQDRITGNPSAANTVAAFTSGNATREHAKCAENMAHIGEADLACQVTAQDVLAQIGAGAIPALTEKLKSTRENERIGAAKALGAIGPAAESAFPLLEQLHRDPSANVRNAAVDAAKKVKPKKGWFSR
jgi:hypothetical protein